MYRFFDNDKISLFHPTVEIVFTVPRIKQRLGTDVVSRALNDQTKSLDRALRCDDILFEIYGVSAHESSPETFVVSAGAQCELGRTRLVVRKYALLFHGGILDGTSRGGR